MSNRRHRERPIETDPPVIERPRWWARLSALLGMGPTSGPACVAEVTTDAEAHVIAGFLQSNDINAQVMGISWGGAYPYDRPGVGVRVLVPADQEQEARRLLADAEESR